MSVSDKQLNKVARLNRQCVKLRTQMGDMTSAPQLIIRKPNQRHALFLERQEKLRKLEVELLAYVKWVISIPSSEP